MKQPMLQRNIIFALVLLLALATAIGFFYMRLPRSAASLLGGDVTQITRAYVLDLRASGASADLSPEETAKLWALLENTPVYWQGTSKSVSWHPDDGRYALGIETGQAFRYVDFFGATQLTVGPWRYSGDTTAIVALLQDSWAAAQT